MNNYGTAQTKSEQQVWLQTGVLYVQHTDFLCTSSFNITTTFAFFLVYIIWLQEIFGVCAYVFLM